MRQLDNSCHQMSSRKLGPCVNEEKSWLGLNDISTEGNFTWADRGEGNFSNWAKNQPNNFNEEDCVHALGVKYNYEWNDVNCSDCHQYTCQKGRKNL